MGYISTIKTAVQLFPFLAFLLTLPYMILNYRKYGSVNKLRVLIFYSFMLYLMTVYLLAVSYTHLDVYKRQILDSVDDEVGLSLSFSTIIIWSFVGRADI